MPSRPADIAVYIWGGKGISLIFQCFLIWVFFYGFCKIKISWYPQVKIKVENSISVMGGYLSLKSVY